MSTGDCALHSAKFADVSVSNIQGVGSKGHVHFSDDPIGLQVVCVSLQQGSASQGLLKQVYSQRRKGVYPLVIAARFEDRLWIFGPNPESPVLGPLPSGRGFAILQEALNERTGFDATQRLAQIREALSSSEKVSVRNAGLFASHHIRRNLPESAEWQVGLEKSRSVVNLRGKKLIEGLGFTQTVSAHDFLLLSSSPEKPSRALAVLLDEGENFDARSPRFNLTPVAAGLKVAAEHEVPWLIVLRGGQIRLYPAKDGVGVGQRSQVDTYFEIDLPLLDESEFPYLYLVFSVDALVEGGFTDQILKDSAKFASELGSRLRERIYESVVPTLSKGVAEQLPKLGLELNSENLQLAYRLTLRILFRLIFQAYAEDRGLLPFERNETYTANALKTIAVRDLVREDIEFDTDSTSIWDDLQQVWKVIDVGDQKGWSVPAYNGGLFGSDSVRHPEGALVRKLELPNSVVGPALAALLIDDTLDNTRGPVDFRSLSVREFGTIYEGLLESSLSIANENLTLDKNGAWIPAADDDVIEAAAGTVYFHNSSGERKATGSYFTPSIIVEHLLDRALEPALEKHLEHIANLISEGKLNQAAEKFFDFRVADLAMGSAHFLVAAVDRIETAFRNFLVDHTIPAVSDELIRLKEAAHKALGDDAEYVADVDEASLLRRQVARRCIYGIDINDMAVELARLALWIHTFVPGLPMSSLDHGLVCANSLTGIGTFQEVDDILEIRGTLFETKMLEALAEAKVLLQEAANANEADKQEVLKNAEILAKAKEAAEPIRKMFDAAVAIRLGIVKHIPNAFDELLEIADQDEVQKALKPLQPAHFPHLYPEVFMRDNPGFDVILGNPPWEEITVEEDKFFKKFIPGYANLSVAEAKSLVEQVLIKRPFLASELQYLKEIAAARRHAVLRGPFKGMGNGDPDLYKGFTWRNIQLIRKNCGIALVLPRGAWVTQGSGAWRKALFEDNSVQIELMRNTRGWLFENVNDGYQITCMSLRSGVKPGLTVRGEFNSAAQFNNDRNADVPEIPLDKLFESDPDVCVPSVNSQTSLNLWIHLLGFPGLGNGRENPRNDFACAPVREIDATDGHKKLNLFTSNPKDFPVHNHTNIGFYEFDTVTKPFEYAEFDKTLRHLIDFRLRTFRRSDSAFGIRNEKWNLDSKTHPCLHPRIAFRDVVHSSNQKKSWFALLPGRTILTNKAPYLVFSNDDVQVQSYILAVLNSSIVDWFAHLRVNLNLNYFILYALPVPEYVDSAVTNRISYLSRALSVSQNYDFKEWQVDVLPIVEESERKKAIAEIDAICSLIFEIPEDLMIEIWDGVNIYRPKLDEVLEFRNIWSNKQ